MVARCDHLWFARRRTSGKIATLQLCLSHKTPFLRTLPPLYKRPIRRLGITSSYFQS